MDANPIGVDRADHDDPTVCKPVQGMLVGIADLRGTGLVAGLALNTYYDGLANQYGTGFESLISRVLVLSQCPQ